MSVRVAIAIFLLCKSPPLMAHPLQILRCPHQETSRRWNRILLKLGPSSSWIDQCQRISIYKHIITHTHIYIYIMIMHILYVTEGSLEVKLPTVWTDEEQREESEKRREEERKSKKRKPQKKEDPGARKGKKVAKHCVFSNDLWLRKVEK